MRTTIVGLFDEEESAKFLHQEIQNRGIHERDTEALSWRRLSEGDDPWNINPGGRSDSDIATNLAAHLRNWGIPEDDSWDFAKAVREGGNIVLVRSQDTDKIDEIEQLMEKNEAIDLDDRRAMWRDKAHMRDESFPEDHHENTVLRAGGPSTDMSSNGTLAQDTHDRYAGASRDVASTARLHKPATHDDAGLQEAHEELRVSKKKVAVGTVRVHKQVKEEEVEEDIKLRSETVEIERRPIDPSEKIDDADDIFREETIEFTEYAEEPVVEKVVRLDDEYVAKHNVEEHKETVHDTVRRTVVNIEPLTRELRPEDSYDSHEPHFREHYTGNFAEHGGYDEYSPAYRYGHAFGASEQYADFSYDEVEPALRHSYEAQYGSGTFDRYRDAARYGFDSTRRH